MKNSLWIPFNPRTGSSCLMQLSIKMGYFPFTDPLGAAHLPHSANLRGFYESQSVNKNAPETLKDLDLSGRSVKIPARHIPKLLTNGTRPTHALVPRRDVEDSEKSWEIAFASLSGKLIRTWDEMHSNLDRAVEMLRQYQVPFMEVRFKELINNPEATCSAIANFLDIEPSLIPSMINTIDKDLPQVG